MSKLPGASDSSDGSGRERSGSFYIIATMADTTWRMFVPTLGLLLLGNWFDGRVHTAPWLMLLGAALGACVAWVLIKQQLAKGNK